MIIIEYKIINEVLDGLEVVRFAVGYFVVGRITVEIVIRVQTVDYIKNLPPKKNFWGKCHR